MSGRSHHNIIFYPNFRYAEAVASTHTVCLLDFIHKLRFLRPARDSSSRKSRPSPSHDDALEATREDLKKCLKTIEILEESLRVSKRKLQATELGKRSEHFHSRMKNGAEEITLQLVCWSDRARSGKPIETRVIGTGKKE